MNKAVLIPNGEEYIFVIYKNDDEYSFVIGSSNDKAAFFKKVTDTVRPHEYSGNTEYVGFGTSEVVNTYGALLQAIRFTLKLP